MAIQTFTLKSKSGLELSVLNYGATITSLKVPTQSEAIDVVLGYNTPEDYQRSFEKSHATYFGAVVGRFAGRIREGRFNLNGKNIQLEQNFGSHHLHGGSQGLSSKEWNLVSIHHTDEPSVTLSVESPTAEDGYPGDVKVEVTYTLTLNNELDIRYKASSTEDTLLNLTQHTYFNLEGHFSDMNNQLLSINASEVLDTDTNNVPTGKLIALEGHEFDFTTPKPVPSQIDHAFVLNSENDIAAELYSKKTNLQMQVITNQPCVQIYVGGKLPADLPPKGSSIYHNTSGICFETQVHPDAPNHEHFPSAELKKGEVYSQHTLFKFQLKNSN